MSVVSKNSLRVVIPVVLLIAVIGFAAHWWLVGRFFESTDDAYVRADISAITPRVGGEVMAVHVVENQLVHAGDLMIEIDSRDYEARLANAQAALDSAQAALTSNTLQIQLQQTNIAEARATLAASRADQVRLENDWHRSTQLVHDGVATAQRLDTAVAAYKSGHASVDKAVAGLTASEQQVGALQADGKRLQGQIDAQKAALQLAQIDLDSTTLRAPIDGAVGDLAARVGERVSPGERLLSLVPLQAVYVEANFKETQLTHMRIGQPLSITVDTFPGQSLRGHVDSLAPASGAEFSLLPPQNASGNFTKIVQRVPVKLALESDEPLRGSLRPGMSAVVRVDVHPVDKTDRRATPSTPSQ